MGTPFRPRYLQAKNRIRNLAQGLYEDDEGQFVSYRDWLIRNGGRRMERAIIKAQQRYDRLKPARIRASALRSAYRRRSR